MLTIDLRSDKFTYEMRISLGKTLDNYFKRRKAGEVIEDFELFKAMYKNIHGEDVKITRKNANDAIKYFDEIKDTLIYWFEMEKKLRNKPTQDQLKAGIENISKKLGEFAVIMTLAEKFKKDPDDILKWSYGKVFGILYHDMILANYNKNLQKIENSKIKKR